MTAVRAEHAARPLSGAEIRTLTSKLNARPLPPDRPRGDATRARPSPPSPKPEPGRVASYAELLELTAATGEIVESMDMAFGRSETKLDAMQMRFDNQLAALKNENQSLRLILENLRITQRGERGIDGDRGPPGRDGRDGVGQIGPQGPQGERGPPAVAIAAWEARPERLEIVPVYSDNSRGVPANLRSLFEFAIGEDDTEEG
jgi:hypothetical protein